MIYQESATTLIKKADERITVLKQHMAKKNRHNNKHKSAKKRQYQSLKELTNESTCICSHFSQLWQEATTTLRSDPDKGNINMVHNDEEIKDPKGPDDEENSVSTADKETEKNDVNAIINGEGEDTGFTPAIFVEETTEPGEAPASETTGTAHEAEEVPASDDLSMGDPDDNITEPLTQEPYGSLPPEIRAVIAELMSSDSLDGPGKQQLVENIIRSLTTAHYPNTGGAERRGFLLRARKVIEAVADEKRAKALIQMCIDDGRMPSDDESLPEELPMSLAKIRAYMEPTTPGSTDYWNDQLD